MLKPVQASSPTFRDIIEGGFLYSELAFSTYELERLEIVPLLFQTGYLTIKSYDRVERIYTLKHEKYYQSLFYLIFKMLGLRIDAEVNTNTRRIDAVIALPDQVFLFEFKLDGSADDALVQIKQNQYYQKYRLMALPITLIGANFDSAQRQVTEWKTKTLAAKLP